MFKILKYQFENGIFEQELDLPIRAEILDFQFQNNLPTIWCWVNMHVTQLETRKFQFVMTGQAIDSIARLKYIGTQQIDAIVVHLFEVV